MQCMCTLPTPNKLMLVGNNNNNRHTVTMTTEGHTPTRLTVPPLDGERAVRPKEVHFASPVAGVSM